MPIKLSLILTAYNEEAVASSTVNETLQALRSLGDEFELVLVDNGSRDQTGTIMEELSRQNKNIRVEHVKNNRGYGYGVVKGIRSSRGGIVAYAPIDGQMDPKVLLPMLNTLLSQRADFVIASRSSRQDSWLRRINSKLFNWIMRAAFKIPIKDINGEPKMMSRSVFEKTRPISDGSFLDAELVLRVKELGAKWHEYPMTSPKRQGGNSKVNLILSLKFLKNIILYFLLGRSFDQCGHPVE